MAENNWTSQNNGEYPDSPIQGEELRKFVAPEIVFGTGALDLVGRYAQNLSAKKVFVVTDPGVLEAGWANKVLQNLSEADLAYEVFSDVTENPKEREVMSGANRYLRSGCDVIVTVGGGSPIDCAKGIGIVATNNHHILEFEGVDEVGVPGPPLICIPTTAGTAADVSQFAIITDRSRRIKIAIVSKKIVPDVSLIDPRTGTTMDTELTACTGMDTLTHAIEAYVSNAHSPLTDLHALQAIRLVAANLVDSCRCRDNIHANTQMMLATLYAGLAFSNASLGAVHAMAHCLGGGYDLPHGLSNALLLDKVVRINYPACPDRYREICQAIGLDTSGCDTDQCCQLLCQSIQQLRESVGLTGTLKGTLDLTTQEITQLSNNALADPCMTTNPRELDLEDLEVIYGQLF